MTQRRRASFFVHKARQHGDIETDNTTARPQQGSLETGITSAPENCTKNAHFAPAKAMTVSVKARPAPAKATPVSTPHEHKRAKATTVSDNRTPGRQGQAAAPMGGGGSWPDRETTRQARPQHTRHRRCGGRRRDRRARAGFETRHRAKRGCLVSRAAGPSGAWNTSGTTSNTINEARRRTTPRYTRRRRCGGRRRDLPRCRWAVAGPGRASRRRAEPKARGADGSRAGHRPPAPQRPGPPAPGTPAVQHAT